MALGLMNKTGASALDKTGEYPPAWLWHADGELHDIALGSFPAEMIGGGGTSDGKRGRIRCTDGGNGLHDMSEHSDGDVSVLVCILQRKCDGVRVLGSGNDPGLAE